MIKNIFKNSFFQLVTIPLVFLIILIFSYFNYGKFLPISYWDEFLWVGRSYFFDFFITRDFNDKVWQSYEAYDQPKLAEYVYGAWIYPLYIIEKTKQKQSFSYTQFLIKNGFYEDNENFKNNYSKLKDNIMLLKIDEKEDGYVKDWIEKYGNKIIKPLNLIYYARLLNIFLLAGAVILAYYIAFYYKGLIFAIFFSFFYGFNSLIISTGLKAHSEALFLFTFNAAIFFMINYFIKNRRFIYLLLFSLFSSLSMSTKLNGGFLLVIFLMANFILLIFCKEKIKIFLHSLIFLLIGLIIFISLNPFTYSNPLKNTLFMFENRFKTAVFQSKVFYHSFISQDQAIKKIFENFYFSEKSQYFNKIYFIKSKKYGLYFFVLFIIGFISLLKDIFKKNLVALIMFVSFLIILFFMNYYLILDWDRYYVHLVLFFVFFQLNGLFVLFKLFFQSIFPQIFFQK
ncbi:MAG: hypothetical protein Fur009_5810 [Candidatus Microgenomates bacterium]